MDAAYAGVPRELHRLAFGHSDSVRWCSDLGIAVLVLDRDGRILSLTIPTASADAHLSRARAFAVTNQTGLEIARYLVREKVHGQGAGAPSNLRR
jgi:CRISPR/Cas system-associated endonuclease Cas1